MTSTLTDYRDTDGRFIHTVWPGGYPVFYLTADAGVLCPDCANGDNGSEATTAADAPRYWQVVDAGIHWEGPDETCAHCAAAIPSAYGDPDTDEEEDATDQGAAS